MGRLGDASGFPPLTATTAERMSFLLGAYGVRQKLAPGDVRNASPVWMSWLR